MEAASQRLLNVRKDISHKMPSKWADSTKQAALCRDLRKNDILAFFTESNV